MTWSFAKGSLDVSHPVPKRLRSLHRLLQTARNPSFACAFGSLFRTQSVLDGVPEMLVRLERCAQDTCRFPSCRRRLSLLREFPIPLGVLRPFWVFLFADVNYRAHEWPSLTTLAATCATLSYLETEHAIWLSIITNFGDWLICSSGESLR